MCGRVCVKRERLHGPGWGFKACFPDGWAGTLFHAYSNVMDFVSVENGVGMVVVQRLPRVQKIVAVMWL